MFHSNILAFKIAVLTFIHTAAGSETKQVLSHTGTRDNNWPSCLQLATKVCSFGKVTCSLLAWRKGEDSSITLDIQQKVQWPPLKFPKVAKT